MTALDAALALAQRHHPAVRVGEHLNLDVARTLEVLLDVDVARSERSQRLTLRSLEGGFELRGLVHQTHPLAATPGHSLQQHRKAEPRGLVAGPLRVRNGLGRTGHNRHPGGLHAAPRLRLVPHRHDRGGRGPDEHEARAGDGIGERRPLRKESVSRMDRLATGGPRGFDQPAHVQVRIDRRRGPDRHRELRRAHVRREAISLGVDRDRLEPLLVAGADDAEGDLAAVRDENAGDGRHQASDIGADV